MNWKYFQSHERKKKMNHYGNLTEVEYNEMIDLFVASVSNKKEEQNKIREHLKRCEFADFQKYYYRFCDDLSDETKENIRVVRELVEEYQAR